MHALDRPAYSSGLSRPRRLLGLLAIGLASSISALAAGQSDTIDNAERIATIKRIGTLINERYVFPEVAAECAEQLSTMLSSGAFDNVRDGDDFAAQLTTALQDISQDKHMLVRTRYIPPAHTNTDAEAREHPIQTRARRKMLQRKQNFGFENVTRLEGNIGYLDIRSFAGHPEAETVAAAAMNFLAHTDALIFDMRNNGGGHPHMVRVLCSYLFDKPTHLNSLYWREGDQMQEFWTIDVPGQKRPDVPVFVLTSSTTFSGAEEFCYNLRTQKRATLVGETTRGGANPGTLFPIDAQLEIFIPTGRAINPITGTNWEGTGVEPHVSVEADMALDAALKLAGSAAEAYRQKRKEGLDAFDPWHIDARRLDDEGKSNDAARTLSESLRDAHEIGLVNEGDINQYGYEFLGEERHALAIAAFSLNVDLYHESANAYDSLGEAYRSDGQIDKAIANYERAVELRPDGPNAENARAILDEIRESREK